MTIDLSLRNIFGYFTLKTELMNFQKETICSLWFSGLSSALSRCLHELRPHGGRPLSCLLFCDNHKRQDPEWVNTRWLYFPVTDHVWLLFLSSVQSNLNCSSKGSFLALSDNRSRSEPGAEALVHCFLELFTDHQVIAALHKLLLLLFFWHYNSDETFHIAYYAPRMYYM